MAQQTLIAWKSLNAEVLPQGNVVWTILNNKPVVKLPNSGDYPYFYVNGSIPYIYNSGGLNLGFIAATDATGVYSFNFQFETLFSGSGRIDMNTSNFQSTSTLQFTVNTENSISKQNCFITQAKANNLYRYDLFRLKISGSGNPGNSYLLGLYLSEDPESAYEGGFDEGFG